jgi:D-serine deaminase-like pyridoxal phosphate-dependent protein
MPSDRVRQLIAANRRQCLAEGPGAPAFIGSDTRIFGGLDDGFGSDRFARRIARERAAAEGFDTSGCKYFPEMVPEGGGVGHRLGWAKDRADLERNADMLRQIDGVNVELDGIGGTKRFSAPEKPDRPYTVAEDLVQDEADWSVATQHNGRIKKDDYDALCDDIREKRSGRAPGDDE